MTNDYKHSEITEISAQFKFQFCSCARIKQRYDRLRVLYMLSFVCFTINLSHFVMQPYWPSHLPFSGEMAHDAIFKTSNIYFVYDKFKLMKHRNATLDLNSINLPFYVRFKQVGIKLRRFIKSMTISPGLTLINANHVVKACWFAY